MPGKKSLNLLKWQIKVYHNIKKVKYKLVNYNNNNGRYIY